MRSRSLLFGVSLVLCACGKKFEAADATAGSGGAVHAAGAPSGGAGGGADSDDAGTPGGAAPSAGSGGTSLAGAPSNGGGGVAGGTSEADAGEPSPISLTGLALWLRADRGVVIKDGHVEQWLDQSGNAMDAIQTAPDLRPTLSDNGLNDLPAVQFDGKAAYLRLPDGFADFKQGLSGFVVSQPTDGACSSMVELSNGTETDDVSFGLWQGDWHYEIEDGELQGAALSSKSPTLFSALHRPSQEVSLRINESLLTPGSFALPELKLRQQNFVGHTLYAGCNYFEGQISEVVLYNRLVSDKEVLTIEAYLQQHWALQFASATP